MTQSSIAVGATSTALAGRRRRPIHDPFEDVRCIGVLTASGIGDFLAAVPALGALQGAYPDAELVVLGDHWHPAFLDGRPGPWSHALAVPRTEGVCRLDEDRGSRLRDFVTQHVGAHDLVVQLHGGGAQSNAVVQALKPRHSVGAWTAGAPELERRVHYVGGRPEVLRCLEVVELAGARSAVRAADLVPTITVTDRDVDTSRLAWPGRRPFLLVHPGARDPRRCWSPDRFASVAKELRRAHGFDVVVVGSARDGRAARAVMGDLGDDGSDLTGCLSLGALLGLAARCSIFIGNDSGPRHVAAASGAPTVGLFLNRNLAAFGPLVGDTQRAVSSDRAHCPVCGDSGETCGHRMSWLDEVSVDQVIDACEAALHADQDRREQWP
jgi:ADP-heptose:LPS heptosyltransferase